MVKKGLIEKPMDQQELEQLLDMEPGGATNNTATRSMANCKCC